MGFTISSVWLPPGPFVDLILDVCPNVLVLSVLPCRCNTLPDVVFLDLLSIPPVERLSGSYWRAWTTPHVFFFWAGDTDSSSPAPCPPVGWVAKSITMSHCEAGGATSGRWRIQVWYPPGAVVIEPVVLDPFLGCQSGVWFWTGSPRLQWLWLIFQRTFRRFRGWFVKMSKSGVGLSNSGAFSLPPTSHLTSF